MSINKSAAKTFELFKHQCYEIGIAKQAADESEVFWTLEGLV